MTRRPTTPVRKSPGLRGFALIVTLSLMILLTVIAVGLLTLSSVSLRSTNQTSVMATARANAKLAMMIAIGNLQNELGSDQRISANAAITNPTTAVANPQWLGAWDSWKAGTQVSTGDTVSAHQTLAPGGLPNAGSMKPSYADKRSVQFRYQEIPGPCGQGLSLSFISKSRSSVRWPEILPSW